MYIAEELAAEFVYAERMPEPNGEGLFPVSYRIPTELRDLRGRRVAIANDVINAGSAVRGTLKDLQRCGAHVVAIGSLLTLGSEPAKLAGESSVKLETLEQVSNTVWLPNQCPLCAAGTPLTPFPPEG